MNPNIAALVAVQALAETIKALGSVPEGHLYARVMSRISHQNFTMFIDILIEAGVVQRTPAHELVWIGQNRSIT